MASRVNLQIKLSNGQSWSLRCDHNGSQPHVGGVISDVVDTAKQVLRDGLDVTLNIARSRARLSIEIPCCSDNHHFVVFPLVLDEAGVYSHTVYGVDVGENSYLTMADILSRFSEAFGQDLRNEIMSLIPDDVTREDVPVPLEMHSYMYDDIEVQEKRRRFGCGTVFLAELADQGASPTYSSRSTSPHWGFPSSVGPFRDSFVDVSGHDGANKNVVVPVPYAPQSESEQFSPQGNIRDGPQCVTQSLVFTAHHQNVPKGLNTHAGETDEVRYPANTPSSAQKFLYRLRNETPTTELPRPMTEIALNLEEQTPEGDGEEEVGEPAEESGSSHHSSTQSLEQSHLDVPKVQQQQALCSGNFKFRTPSEQGTLVAGIVASKIPNDSHGEQPSPAPFSNPREDAQETHSEPASQAFTSSSKGALQETHSEPPSQKVLQKTTQESRKEPLSQAAFPKVESVQETHSEPASLAAVTFERGELDQEMHRLQAEPVSEPTESNRIVSSKPTVPSVSPQVMGLSLSPVAAKVMNVSHRRSISSSSQYESAAETHNESEHVVPVQRQISTKGEMVAGEKIADRKSLSLPLSIQGDVLSQCDDVSQKESQEPELSFTREYSTATKSEPDEELLNVHALEHACNGRHAVCILGKDLCLKFNDPVRISRMNDAVRSYRDGAHASEELKHFIRKHCWSPCRDPNCDVPHLAAGCPRPGEIPTPTPTSSVTPYSCTTRAIGITDLSFDLQCANHSEIESPGLRESGLHDPTGVTRNGQCTGGVISQSSVAKVTGVHRPAPTLPINQPDSPHHRYPPTGVASPDVPGPLGQCYPATPGPRHVLHVRHPHPLDTVTHIGGTGYLESHDLLVRQRRYSYIQPNREGNELIRRTQHPSQDIPETLIALTNGFPSFNVYSSYGCKRGSVIYSKEQNLVISGSNIPVPNLEKTPYGDILGTGGNGKIVTFRLRGQDLAVKSTLYRQCELSLWTRFDHRNIVPLLAVVLGDNHSCFQFMRRMDDNLSRIMKIVGSLDEAKKRASPPEWDVVMANVRYILREILNGLDYLHNLSIQHCDVKASNILILKRCGCANIFQCMCPTSEKYLVQIADFDSAKTSTTRHQDYTNLPEVPCVPKPEEECGKVMGTPGYRAPEQFWKQPPVVSPCYIVQDDEGPWCDIWSFGHIVLQMFLGPNKPQDKQDSWKILGHPHLKDFSRILTQPEIVHTQLKLKGLLLSGHQKAGKFADTCLTVDFKKRPTAKQLLKDPFLLD